MHLGSSQKPINIVGFTSASASASFGVTTMSFIDKRCAHICIFILSLLILVQCDTFSRSTDAVFELSLRFADPFKISEKFSPAEKLEAERQMFLELTQG